jgi:enterochelin esterase family protein
VAALVEDAGALLTVDDPTGRWRSVSLWYHLRRPYPDRTFDLVDGQWRYWLPRPPVDRLEYLIERTTSNGGTEMVLDDGNDVTVPGAFGSHSVLEFPGYSPPAWLGWEAPTGTRVEALLPHARGLRRDLPVTLWTPTGYGDEMLPLLLVHDGPEMDRFASLTRYAAAMIARRVLPPFRVGLLAPGDRDAWYSASPAYARLLAEAAVPALLRVVPTSGRPVLVGASLGALSALHVEWTHPGTFAALFLASGSFFTMRYDEQESGHARFFRIASAVERIVDGPASPTSAPMTLVCGTGEENWENNQAMLAALTRMGAPVTFEAFRDGHTWVGWRDSFDPGLTGLLRSVWGSPVQH